MDGKIESESPGSSESELLEQQLRRASKIARLELSEGEMQGLLKDARAIFEKFSEIQELNLSIAPVKLGETAEMPLREDGPVVVFESIGKLLDQVPKKEGERLIKAPKSL